MSVMGMNGKAAVGCLVLIDLFCYDWAFGFLMLLVDPAKNYGCCWKWIKKIQYYVGQRKTCTQAQAHKRVHLRTGSNW